MNTEVYLSPLPDWEALHRQDLYAQLAEANTDPFTYERCVQTVTAMDQAKEVCAWASGMVDELGQLTEQLEGLTRAPEAFAAALRVLPPEKLEALHTAFNHILAAIEHHTRM